MAGWLSCHTFPTSPQSLAPPEAKIVEAVTPGQILTIEPMEFADKCSVRGKRRGGSRMMPRFFGWAIGSMELLCTDMAEAIRKFRRGLEFNFVQIYIRDAIKYLKEDIKRVIEYSRGEG